MIDLQKVSKELEAYKENCKGRGLDLDVDAVLALDAERKKSLTELQKLQEKQNEVARSMKGKIEQSEREALIKKGKELKTEVSTLDSKVAEITKEFEAKAKVLPNFTHPEVPEGGEEDAKELRRFLEPKQFNFKPLDHLELSKKHDLVDFEMGRTVAGSKFYFLKNEAVLLEMALTHFALDLLRKKGFQLVTTPDLAKEEILDGVGFSPRGEESQIYCIEGHDLCLIGTAEIPIGGAYRNKILDRSELPLKIAGLSHCFRTEAGSHGRESKGLYRIHQFTKVEMFSFTTPEASEKAHLELLAIEEEIYQALEIPYRVVDIAKADLGAPAYRKYDIEAWMYGRGETGGYGEVTSTSNCIDYQSRRLKIRYRDDEGKSQYIHTLNGTAIAMPRTIIALLENGQREDGSIELPKALHPYLPFKTIG